MLKSKTQKRPCCICHKWFLPDVRQKNRQKTCNNPKCRNELHRRLCARWYKKNKSDYKSHYLSNKLAKVGDPPSRPCSPQPVKRKPDIPKSRMKPILPPDIALREVGVRNLILMEYAACQILDRIGGQVSSSP